jgi:hypothetical protein
MAAEKLLRKCSTSWEAYNTRETAHDGWLPNSACQQLRRIIKKNTGAIAPEPRIRVGI